MKIKQINLFIDELKKTFISKEEPGLFLIGSWQKFLKGVNYGDASEAVLTMLADENKEVYGFPTPGDLKPYLSEEEMRGERKQCPCCNNTTFIQFWKDKSKGITTPVFKCQCTPLGKKKWWERDGHDICNNNFCQNPYHLSRIYVPPGWGQHEKLLLAGCKFSPTITESRDWQTIDRDNYNKKHGVTTA
jgi:hypothetical protein